MEDLSGARGILRSAWPAFVTDQQSCLSAAAQRWVESRRALHEDAVGDVSAGADGDLRRGKGQLRKEPVADRGVCGERENAAAGDRGARPATWIFGAAAKAGGSGPQGHRRFCDHARWRGAAGDSPCRNGVARAYGGAFCGRACCKDGCGRSWVGIFDDDSQEFLFPNTQEMALTLDKRD